MMLVSGSRVQFRGDGATKCVEALQIGELIYDPLNEGYNEITDILSRTIDLEEAGSHRLKSLFPVVVGREYALKSHGQKASVFSPQQEILFCANMGTMQGLVSRTAAEIGTTVTERPREITYHAVFFAQRRPILVDGVLCQSFDISVFRDGPSSAPGQSKGCSFSQLETSNS